MCHLPALPRRVLGGLLVVALFSAVAVLAAAPPAAAHGTLAMSTPTDGATVSRPLTAVELYFTEQVASNAYFTITAPGGGRVDNGWTNGSPKPLDKPVREYFMVEGKFEPREYTTGFPAVVTVAHLPEVGLYSVSYLSVASDGEAVRGTMTFRYTGASTPAPQGWTPPTNQPDPALMAAVERHGMSGQNSGSSSAAPAVPPASSPPPAAAAPAEQTGGSGWLVWTGWAVAVAVAVAGLLLWRRRPAPAGPSGRARTSARSRQQPGNPRSSAKAGAAGKANARGKGGRPAAVPAARKGGAAVTARTAATVKASATGAVTTADADPAASSDTDRAAPVVAPAAGGLTNARLALLAGGVVAALLAGFGLGRVGTATERSTGGPTPTAVTASAGAVLSAGDSHQHAPGTGPHSHSGDSNTAQATGTTVSAGGYTLRPVQRSQPAGTTADYRFRIVGTDRKPVTRFAVVHEKPLHMIVVGRDLSGYQHLHPTMDPDGTWSVALELARAGGYRIYADFTVTGVDGTQLPLVLGVDHQVPGAHTPAELPPAEPQASTGPFLVSMQGTPTVGVTAPLFFRVSRTGTPGPTQLERYLGAYGHLVVIREGDLGYVHVHPEPQLVDGAVKFWVTAPSTGRYRAFFDFQIGGKVQTAQYTIDLP